MRWRDLAGSIRDQWSLPVPPILAAKMGPDFTRFQNPTANESSAAVFTNVRLRSSGDHINSVLSGNIAFVESRIHDDLHLIPLFRAEPQSSPYMEFLAGLLPVYLSPSAQGTLDLSVSTADPIRMGMLPLTGELTCDLKLRGSLKAPVPSGRVTLSNMPVHLPSGRLLMNQGTMDFLSEEPWNPILMAKASGWLAQQFIEATVFGKFSEGRWLLRSRDGFLSPQDLTLLLEIGSLPYPDEAVTPLVLATNFRPYVMQSSWHKLLIWAGGCRFLHFASTSTHAMGKRSTIQRQPEFCYGLHCASTQGF